MKHMRTALLPEKTQGFLLVEVIMSIVLLSTIAITFVSVFAPGFFSAIYHKESFEVNQLIKQKGEELQALGYWVWDVDTESPAFPGNADDPAVKWKAYLQSRDFDSQAVMTTTFLKDVSGTLTDFSGDFDGNNARDKARVNISLTTSTGGTISQDILLFMRPTTPKLKASIYIIQTALKIYNTENAGYPATGQLNLLVPSILDEIPNDPFTNEKDKTTHIEEVSDWKYEKFSSPDFISISPNSHPEIVVTWNY
jgi:type II secretory pathway pseudopilin PulG